MEEFEVILLPSAEEDLSNIYNYISKELNSEINARLFVFGNIKICAHYFYSCLQ